MLLDLLLTVATLATVALGAWFVVDWLAWSDLPGLTADRMRMPEAGPARRST